MSKFNGGFSRRNFLKLTGLSGAALLSGCTGSSDGESSYSPWPQKYGEELLSCACMNNCANGCHLYAHRRNGRIVKMSMAPMPDTRYNRACLRGLSHAQRIYGKNRIMYPLKRVSAERGNKNGFEAISWDQAVKEISDRFKAIINDSTLNGSKSLAYISGSGNFGTVHGLYGGGYGRLFNALGTSKISASLDLNVAQGYAIPFGMPGATCMLQNQPSDLGNSKTIILWGTNLGSAHIQTWHHVAEARDNNNAQVIAVDIMLNLSAARADKFVCLRPASDTLMALSMIKYIIDQGWVDKPFMFKNTVANFLVDTITKRFVRKSDFTGVATDTEYVAWRGGAVEYTTLNAALGNKTTLAGSYTEYTFEHTGTIALSAINILGMPIQAKTAYQMLIDHVASFDATVTKATTGVDENVVYAIAERYATVKPANITSGFGPDHRTNGHHIYHALGTLAAITGNLGKSGAGVGVCEVMTPYLNSGPINTASNGAAAGVTIPYPIFNDVFDSAVAKSSIDHFGAPIATLPYGGPDELFLGSSVKIRGLFVAFSNLLTNFCETGALIGPDGVFTKKVNGKYKMDTIVVAETEMTDTASYADYILPACHWFEREDYNGFGSHPFAVYQEKVQEPMGESLPDRHIAAKLAKGFGLESEFTETDDDIFKISLDATFYKSWFKGIVGREPTAAELPTPERLRAEKVIRVIPGLDVNGKQEYIYPMWRDGDDLRIDAFSGSGRIEFYCDTLISFTNMGQGYGGSTLVLNPLLTMNENLPTHEPAYEGWHEDTVYNASLRAAGYTLNNFSQRIRWRVHTQWWDTPWIRELEPYPVVFVSPYDVAGKNIRTGDVIKVSNPRGSYRGRAIITPGLQPGLIDAPRGWQRWQYDEYYGTAAGYQLDSGAKDAGSCNDVSSRRVHPFSGCQSFFDALVKIEKIEKI